MSMLGVIGGTGFATLADTTVLESIDIDTPFGRPSGGYCICRLQKQEVVFLPRHGNDHSIPPHKINYRANLYGFKQLGVTEIAAFAAVGGINPRYSSGAIVIPHQIIDYTTGREHTYYDGLNRKTEFLENHLQYIDFTQPYSESVRQKLIEAAGSAGIECIGKGVYGVTQGPRLESAAEIDRFAKDGADIVGMTAMPEAALSKELNIDYGSIAMVVNPAAGRDKEALSMESIMKILLSTTADVLKILQQYNPPGDR